MFINNGGRILAHAAGACGVIDRACSGADGVFADLGLDRPNEFAAIKRFYIVLIG